MHHRGACKPEALKQLDAKALAQVVLQSTFHLLGNQLGTGVAVGKFDQHRQLGRGQSRQVQLDVIGQRQPGRIFRLQHRVVEGQVKALILEGQQRGQACRDFVNGCVAQRGDFQHHLVGGQQLQVLAGQTFMRAVHKHELGAHQIFFARVREGGKDQRRIGRHGVVVRRARAVEQLIANDLLQPIDDGLAGNHAFGQVARRGESRVL